MRKLLLLLIIGICVIGSIESVEAKGWCWQESMNVTDQKGTDGTCGLNYTGNYIYTKEAGNAVDPANWVDGNWSTYVPIGSGDLHRLDINYTKPSVGVEYGTNLSYKRNSYGDVMTNVTLPQTCIDFREDKISIRYRIARDSPNKFTKVYCENSSGFSLIAEYLDLSGYTLYEEAVNWYLEDNPPEYGNIDISSTDLTSNLTFIVDWTDDQSLSAYTFGTNITGTWVNQTTSLFSGITNTSSNSQTRLFNGTSLYWRVYANDTANNWNETGIQSIPVINITFSETTNATLTWGTDGQSYTNVNNITFYSIDIPEGEFSITYNEGQQVYSNTNDWDGSPITETLYIQDPDLVLIMKAVESGMGLEDVKITAYSLVSDEWVEIYSAYTDEEGLAEIQVDDGHTYRFVAEKEGYTTVTKVEYVTPLSTKVYQFVMIPEATSGMTGIFWTVYPKVIYASSTVYGSILSLTDGTLCIDTWENGVYSSNVTCSEAGENQVTYSFTSTESTASNGDGFVFWFEGSIYGYGNITFSNVTNRTVQVTWGLEDYDGDTLKERFENDPSLSFIFYFVIIIMGVIVGVAVEQRYTGLGLYGTLILFTAVALSGFSYLWFAVIPVAIFKAVTAFGEKM